MLPFKTNLTHIGQSILDAHEAGRLGYQSLEAIGKPCLYRYGNGSVCAIGAVIPDPVYDEMQKIAISDGMSTFNSQTVTTLIKEGWLLIEDDYILKDWRPVSSYLQALHDGACQRPTDGWSSQEFIDSLLKIAKALANGERPTASDLR